MSAVRLRYRVRRGGHPARAADVLGISLKTLYNRLEEYGPHDKLRAHSEKLSNAAVAKPLADATCAFIAEFNSSNCSMVIFTVELDHI